MAFDPVARALAQNAVTDATRALATVVASGPAVAITPLPVPVAAPYHATITTPSQSLVYTLAAAIIPVIIAAGSYADGQQCWLSWGDGTTPGTTYALAAEGAGMRLAMAAVLAQPGDKILLAYNIETSRWHELARSIAGNFTNYLSGATNVNDGAAGALFTTIQGFIGRLMSSVGSALVGFLQAGTGALTRTVQDKLRETVSIEDFGAVGDGVTDDSAAFTAFLAYAATKVRSGADTMYSPNMGSVTCLLAGKNYLINQPEAMLAATSFVGHGTVQGLAYRGVSGVTQIIYDPVTPGPLFYDNDNTMLVRCSGISFYGKSATSDFIYSVSTGQAQDFGFDECLFEGIWRYGINLVGSNCNSEHKYVRCIWTGAWMVWLYTAATGTADQFLNYWFLHGKYDSSSPWIDMSAGGSIKITDCDASGYQPTTDMFLFNLRGNNHAYSVCNLKIDGLRIEQKTVHAGILYSEWGDGNISLNAIDASSAAYQTYAPNNLSYSFNTGNSPGAIVGMTNCSIMGKMQWTYGAGVFYIPKYAINNSAFLNYATPDLAMVFVNGAGQPGRIPVIRLADCQGTNASAYMDADINWQAAFIGGTSRKAVSLQTVYAQMPDVSDGPWGVTLPPNVLITRILLYAPSGCCTSSTTGCVYKVETGEATPTVLVTVTVTGSLSGGFVSDTTLNFACASALQQVINFVPVSGADQRLNNSYCIIEYYG